MQVPERKTDNTNYPNISMKLILPVLCFLFLSLSAFSQQAQTVEKLKAELEQAKADTALLRLNTVLAELYFRSEPDKTIEYGEKAIALAEKLDSLRWKARALNCMGVAYVIMSEIDKSLDHHYRALKIREDLKDSLGMALSYLNIGNAHIRSANPEKALEMFKKSEIISLALNEKRVLSWVYNNTATIYKDNGDIKKALHYLLQSVKLKEETNDRTGLSASLNHIGDAYLKTGQVQKGLEYLLRAKALDDSLNNISGLIPTLRTLSEAYIAAKEYDKAVEAAKQSLELARKIKSNLEIMLSARSVNKAYVAANDYKHAHHYLMLAAQFSDSVNTAAHLTNITEIQTRYETEKKELENQKLTLEKEQQAKIIRADKQVQFIGAAALAMLLILALLLFYSRRRIQVHNTELQQVNEQVQAQNVEIKRRSAKIKEQAAILEQQRDELAKLNSFKNKIFSIISHDLRSPFASVKGLLNLVHKRNMAETDIKRMLQLLEKEYDVATNLLNNLLIWAKTQMEGANLHLEPISLQELAEENMHLLKTPSEAKEIQLVNLVPDDAVIYADKERINFILRNLLANAVKFTAQGGMILIQAERKEHTIAFSVTDSGQGISPENQERLFSSQRFTTNGTANEKGTGLGLMLCKEFAEDMKGEIAVQSTLGQGTTFTVSIPEALARNTRETVFVS